MYLLALGDTVANTKVDFTEKETADPAAQSGRFQKLFILKILKMMYLFLLFTFKKNCTGIYPV